MPETIVSPTPKASSVWLGHCSSLGGTELPASIVGISDCTITTKSQPIKVRNVAHWLDVVNI